ncbi:MAG TPA: hypothetical protein VLJ60_09545 [bacterium]|nr:hypothetical protein [bacterium]
MKHAILIFTLFLISCNSNSPNVDINLMDNENLPDEINENETPDCIEKNELYESGGGNEKCPYQKYDDFLKRYIGDITGTKDGFVLKIDEILFLEERGEAIPLGECGQTRKCGVTFKNYDRDLFKDSLVGKELVLYLIEGFYGDVYGEYMSRDVQIVRHKDGTLIAVSGVGIVNEDGENDWDEKVWPSSLVPEVKIEQKVLSECESFCVKYQNVEDGQTDQWRIDNFFAPPLEITVKGKSPVVVRNGEVIKSEGYEYFVRNSLHTAKEDSDGYIFKYGKRYKFDFFIVNTEALK